MPPLLRVENLGFSDGSGGKSLSDKSQPTGGIVRQKSHVTRSEKKPFEASTMHGKLAQVYSFQKKRVKPILNDVFPVF